MPKEYLECGKIVTTHGVRGEVKVQPWCDGPEFLGQFGTLYLDAAGTRPVKVLSAKVAGNMSVLKLEGLDTPEEARNWRGRVLYLRRADVKLPGITLSRISSACGSLMPLIRRWNTAWWKMYLPPGPMMCTTLPEKAVPLC